MESQGLQSLESCIGRAGDLNQDAQVFSPVHFH